MAAITHSQAVEWATKYKRLFDENSMNPEARERNERVRKLMMQAIESAPQGTYFAFDYGNVLLAPHDLALQRKTIRGFIKTEWQKSRNVDDLQKDDLDKIIYNDLPQRPVHEEMRKNGLQPPAVFFVDDRADQVEAIKKTVEEMEIPVVSVQYNEAWETTPDLTEQDKELVTHQWDYMLTHKKWLPEHEARQILASR